MNEILLVASLFVIYGCVLLAYRLFGKSGLYCFTAIATITANIEVLSRRWEISCLHPPSW